VCANTAQPRSAAGKRATGMQGFFSSVTSKVLATAAALVADENDEELAPASVSQAEVEFAEVCGRAALALAAAVAAAGPSRRRLMVRRKPGTFLRQRCSLAALCRRAV